MKLFRIVFLEDEEKIFSWNRMISKLEILSDELLLLIISYLSWDEVLSSFWLINTRINSLICEAFSSYKSRIIFDQFGLSHQTFSSSLLARICYSTALTSSIKSLYLDGSTSIFVFIDQYIFYHKNDFTFSLPNLKSLYINNCSPSPSIFQTLSRLIRYQLDHLTLIIHEDISEADNNEYRRRAGVSEKGNFI